MGPDLRVQCCHCKATMARMDAHRHVKQCDVSIIAAIENGHQWNRNTTDYECLTNGTLRTDRVFCFFFFSFSVRVPVGVPEAPDVFHSILPMGDGYFEALALWWTDSSSRDSFFFLVYFCQPSELDLSCA